jgi:hypothetical protein
VAIFIVAYHLVFWVFGAAHSLSWDYAPGVPQGTAAARRISWKEKPLGGWFARHLLGYNPRSDVWEMSEGNRRVDNKNDSEKQPETQATAEQSTEKGSPMPDTPSAPLVAELARTPSRPRAPSLSAPSLSRKQPSLLARILRPLQAVLTPVTCTLLVSLPIALIQPLKSLFVPTPSYAFAGPDGRPPLAFVIDTASFLGGITVPLALVLLGAAFARLRVPRPFSSLPLPAMIAAAAAKMVLLPVVGVLLVQLMTRRGMMNKEDRAERFVAMFLGGTPAAVNQIIVASLYSPDGDVDTLSVSREPSCCRSVKGCVAEMIRLPRLSCLFNVRCLFVHQRIFQC